MTLIGRLRGSLLEKDLRRHTAEYEQTPSESDRHAEQLQLLNREWSRSVDASPYYGELASKHNIPRTFDSLEAFAKAVPVTTKEVVQEHGERIPCLGRAPDKWFMTGGSTNKPIHVPYWKSEIPIIQRDQWMARSWYGVTPSSHLFLLWGHSHLLGTGWSGWLNARLRALRDGLLGYTRFSTYDMREEAMRDAGEALIRVAPDYMLGFSRTLHQCALINADRKAEFRALRLKVIVGTSESFPSSDSIELLEETFHCPVAMEYGAAEVGLIGHTYPQGDYRAFWRSLLLEAEPISEGRFRLLLTGLHPRCFPLVRYEIGDTISLGPDAGEKPVRGLDRFVHVVGRSYDQVVLDDGTVVHFDAFPTALKPWRELRGFQIVCGDGPPRVDYLASMEIPADIEATLRLRLSRVHPSLREMPLRRVETLVQTAAGKTKGVVKKP